MESDQSINESISGQEKHCEHCEHCTKLTLPSQHEECDCKLCIRWCIRCFSSNVFSNASTLTQRFPRVSSFALGVCASTIGLSGYVYYAAPILGNFHYMIDAFKKLPIVSSGCLGTYNHQVFLDKYMPQIFKLSFMMINSLALLYKGVTMIHFAIKQQ